MEQAGTYDIRFDLVKIALTDSSPTLHGTETSLQLDLSSSGFIHPMIAALVSLQGQAYAADGVEIEAASWMDGDGNFVSDNALTNIPVLHKFPLDTKFGCMVSNFGGRWGCCAATENPASG